MSETIPLHSADGHHLNAYVAAPVGAPLGGLVVVQEIFGVNRHIRSVADRFAREGFYAVAPALFDRVQRDVDLGYEGEDMRKAIDLVRKLEIGDAVRDVDAALHYAKEATGKAASVVGYCYGGTLAWLSATRLAPAAAVGYYGGQIAGFAEEKPRAPVMLHFGRLDTHIPEADVARIQAIHPHLEIYWYDAGHGFNCDMRASFNPAAARLALDRSLAFLRRHSAI